MKSLLENNAVLTIIKKMPCWGAGLGCVALLGAGGGIFGHLQ